MALITASFTKRRGKAYAGQIADSSLRNIDGACVANEGETIPIGKLVAVAEIEPADGHKIVAVAKDATLPILGIAVMSHAYSPTGVYEEETAVNVITHGRVWALADAALTDDDVKFKGAVSFNADGIVAAGGAIKTSYQFAGELLPTNDSKYKIALVQVLQSGGLSA